jgi:hypothetical protein
VVRHLRKFPDFARALAGRFPGGTGERDCHFRPLLGPGGEPANRHSFDAPLRAALANGAGQLKGKCVGVRRHSLSS